MCPDGGRALGVFAKALAASKTLAAQCYIIPVNVLMWTTFPTGRAVMETCLCW